MFITKVIRILTAFFTACGGIITEEGIIASPVTIQNGKPSYMGSLDCYWNITAPKDRIVTLTWDHYYNNTWNLIYRRILF